MNDILKQITIPSPCHASWDSMTGDDRTRFCQECGKSVVNLAAMPETEATSLVEEQGNDLCARVTKRKDGSVVTAKPQPRSGIRSLMIAIAWIAGALGFFKFMDQNTVTAGRVRMPRGSACPTPPAIDANGHPVDESVDDLGMTMGQVDLRTSPEVQGR
jgi:hypothetical protein